METTLASNVPRKTKNRICSNTGVLNKNLKSASIAPVQPANLLFNEFATCN
jgi:hypothetical protein